MDAAIPADKLKEWEQHSFALLTLDGEHVHHPMQREHLFGLIGGMQRYIVDGNSHWKAEASKPANKNVAFILGATVTIEEDNLQSVFFSEKLDISHRNVFLLGLVRVTNGLLVQLQRLDPAFRSIFDETKLLEESHPRKLRADSEFQERLQGEKAQLEDAKQQILNILGVPSIAELLDRNALTGLQERIQRDITRNAPACRYSWEDSVKVAVLCFALLLIREGKARTRFGRDDKPNVLGDAMLIRDALFLHAGILSNDKEVRKMASFTGLPELVCDAKVIHRATA